MAISTDIYALGSHFVVMYMFMFKYIYIYYIYTVTDRIIEKNKVGDARAPPGHLQVGKKKDKSGLLVPGYFPMPG